MRITEERHYSCYKGHMALLESRLHTVLSSLDLLDTWLEDGPNTEDVVRVRRIKGWRCETLVELNFIRQQIELVRRELEALEAKG